MSAKNGDLRFSDGSAYRLRPATATDLAKFQEEFGADFDWKRGGLRAFLSAIRMVARRDPEGVEEESWEVIGNHVTTPEDFALVKEAGARFFLSLTSQPSASGTSSPESSA